MDTDILLKPDTPAGDSLVIVPDTSAAAGLKSGQSNRIIDLTNTILFF